MKTKLPTHAYVPDGIPDHRGGQGCAHCPMPKRHPVHDLPPVPAEAAAADARRLGEPTEGDQA